MAKNILIPNKFNCSSSPVGIESLPVWIYCLVDSVGVVHYVGSTSDLTQTKNRHTFRGEEIKDELRLVMLGHFYDRCIAEFVEIKLIEEYIKQGHQLLNKIVGFKDGRI